MSRITTPPISFKTLNNDTSVEYNAESERFMFNGHEYIFKDLVKETKSLIGQASTERQKQLVNRFIKQLKTADDQAIQAYEDLDCCSKFLTFISRLFTGALFGKSSTEKITDLQTKIDDIPVTSRQDAVSFGVSEGMNKNFVKALHEHLIEVDPAYATLTEVIVTSIGANPSRPLTFTRSESSQMGKRPSMEDAHLYIETDLYVLTCVFDGHDGADTANYLQTHFPDQFAVHLEEAAGDAPQALQNTLNALQAQLAIEADVKKSSGSTAVICHINKATNEICTATLGDSEANIYRSIEGSTKSIPLSCVRHWGSEKDFARLRTFDNTYDAYMENGMPNDELIEAMETGKLRAHNPINNNTLNVSRSMGDFDFIDGEDHALVIQKAKITKTQLLPGDVLVLCCDGLKDYASESEIVNCIANPGADANLAEQLANVSVSNQESKPVGDNVTVIAIKVS